MTLEETVSAIKKISIGAVISEYGCLMLKDASKQELKQRVNRLHNATQHVQNYFLTHPNARPQTRETFKKQFLKGEIVLIAELLETVWGLDENDLETIINSIKKNINQCEIR